MIESWTEFRIVINNTKQNFFSFYLPESNKQENKTEDERTSTFNDYY